MLKCLIAGAALLCAWLPLVLLAIGAKTASAGDASQGAVVVRDGLLFLSIWVPIGGVGLLCLAPIVGVVGLIRRVIAR